MTLLKIEALFGRYAFRIYTDALQAPRALNAALFDAQMVATSRVMPPLIEFTADEKREFLIAFRGLLNQQEFHRAVSASTSDEAQVAVRIRQCEDFLRQHFKL